MDPKIWTSTIKKAIYILSILSIILSILFVIIIDNKEYSLQVLMYTSFIVFLLFSIFELKNRITLALFLLSFFVFLLGRDFILFITKADWKEGYSTDVINHFQVSILLSLFGIFLGYIMTKNNHKIKNIKSNITTMKSIYKYVVTFYMLVSIIYVAFIVQRIIFVQNYGYETFYLEFEYSIPFINSIVQQLFYILFTLILVTYPSKERLKPIIITYVLVSILFWFTGQRGTTMLNLFILFWYFAKRDIPIVKIQKTNWLKKRYYVILIVLAPIILSLAYWYSFLRSDMTISDYSLIRGVTGFFESQGRTKRVIMEGYTLINQFPGSKPMYFLSPISNFFSQNRFFSIFFDTPLFKAHTIEYALNGYDFGATISYLILGTNYLNGAAVGSSYIAEVFIAFGYIGVFIFNFLLGKIIKKIEFTLQYRWYYAIFILLAYKYLLFIPRDRALAWIFKGFNFTTIFIIIFIALILNEINIKKHKNELNIHKEKLSILENNIAQNKS